VTQVVQIAGGDDQTITLQMPAPPPPPVDVVAPPPRPSMTIPLVAWAGTGAVVTGAVVTGLLALGASSDLKEKLGAFPGDPSAITAARGKTAAFALATDIITGTAIAAAGVSIFLTVRSSRAPEATAQSARIVVSPTGVGVAGSF
jgi:hypothetical protein